jgi:AraC-like DNA-binding protein
MVPTMADRQRNVPGLRCEERVIGDCELIHYTGGRGEVVLSGERFETRAGMVVLIRPWELHCINSSVDQPHDNYWVHFNVEPAPLADAVLRAVFPDGRRIADIGVDQELCAAYEQLNREIRNKHAGYAALATSLFTGIFLRIWRNINGTLDLPSLDRDELLLTGIEAYIRERIGERLDADRLCRQFSLGRTRLFSLFRDRRGISPAFWIRRERLRGAELLLKTGNLPLKDIAARVGFSDAFHLSRSFKEVYGASPRDWLAMLRY